MKQIPKKKKIGGKRYYYVEEEGSGCQEKPYIDDREGIQGCWGRGEEGSPSIHGVNAKMNIMYRKYKESVSKHSLFHVYYVPGNMWIKRKSEKGVFNGQFDKSHVTKIFLLLKHLPKMPGKTTDLITLWCKGMPYWKFSWRIQSVTLNTHSVQTDDAMMLNVMVLPKKQPQAGGTVDRVESGRHEFEYYLRNSPALWSWTSHLISLFLFPHQ